MFLVNPSGLFKYTARANGSNSAESSIQLAMGEHMIWQINAYKLQCLSLWLISWTFPKGMSSVKQGMPRCLPTFAQNLLIVCLLVVLRDQQSPQRINSQLLPPCEKVITSAHEKVIAYVDPGGLINNHCREINSQLSPPHEKAIASVHEKVIAYVDPGGTD